MNSETDRICRNEAVTDARKLRRRKKMFWPLFGLLYMALIELFSLSVVLAGNSAFGAFVGLSTLLSMGLGLCMASFLREYLDASWKQAMLRMAQEEHKHSFPFCLDLLSSGSDDEATVARNTLLHILPKLTHEDAPTLSARQRDNLHLVLTGNNTPLILAILKFLETAGTGETLPYVSRLARVGWSAVTNKQVRQAACECLPILQQSLENQNKARYLLRASAPNAMHALLRPVLEKQELSPEAREQLLRPGLLEATSCSSALEESVQVARRT